MSDTTYNVYRDGSKIASNLTTKTYTDTGLDPDTEYEYQVSAENEFGESELSNKITVKTEQTKIDSQESLESAITKADAGDSVVIDDSFTLNKDIAINKNITINGNEHTITVDIPNSEVQDSGFRVISGDLSVENININLSEGKNRAFLLHTTAGSFSLKDSSIEGGDISQDGNRGVSSSTDEGHITIDNVVFSGLRTGVYRHGNNELSINNSTFEGNYRGMTIAGNTMPTLTNNTFTNNEGDISTPADSEIRDEFEQEVENAENNNKFDNNTPKYNWGNVTGVTLSPQTSAGETGSAGSVQLTATIEPSDARNKAVTYSIDSTEGLTVDANGKIEWTADTVAGEYTTTVTTSEGGFTDTHVLTLSEPEPEVTIEIETENIDPVEYETVRNETSDLPKGEEEVVQEGKDGYTKVTYEVTYEDGIEAKREETNREVVDPISEIINVGTFEEPETEPEPEGDDE